MEGATGFALAKTKEACRQGLGLAQCERSQGERDQRASLNLNSELMISFRLSQL